MKLFMCRYLFAVFAASSTFASALRSDDDAAEAAEAAEAVEAPPYISNLKM